MTDDYYAHLLVNMTDLERYQVRRYEDHVDALLDCLDHLRGGCDWEYQDEDYATAAEQIAVDHKYADKWLMHAGDLFHTHIPGGQPTQAFRDYRELAYEGAIRAMNELAQYALAYVSGARRIDMEHHARQLETGRRGEQLLLEATG